MIFFDDDYNNDDSLDLDDTDDEEYLDYDEQVERISAENRKYLDIFKKYLKDKGLSKRTINKHIENVEFYLDTFLTYHEIYSMQDGASPDQLNVYFGYFFISKCSGISVSAIKQNAASLKKFYKCMFESGYISKEAYEGVVKTIKKDMPSWIAVFKQYVSNCLGGLF